MSATVLIIDDDLGFADSVKYLLKKQGIRATVASNPAQALKIYAQEKMDFDLLMIDYDFKDSNITGADFAERIKKENPLQAFIFMSGFARDDFYKSMLTVGASKRFIEKGVEPEKIIELVRLTLFEMGIRENTATADTLEDELKRESEIRAFGMVGRSKELHNLVKQTENYRRFKSRFLILGPTGSGKELIAKAFQIPGKPFFAVDCTRFMEGQEHFLESELYGHKKGAYTGADQDKRGAFEVANGGVVFLDELHCLSLTAQSKLLRTLQEMKFRRLGDSSATEIPFDVTLVAAAKPELLTMMERGEFKEDLYYRLAKSELRIPSLAERPDDIKPLAKFFAEKYSRKHNLSKALHPQLLRDMESYSWPGNVREFEGVIENFVMTSIGEVIGPEHFRSYVASKLSPEAVCDNKPQENLRLVVDSIESDHIKGALKKSRFIGNAADILGIPRTTLNDRLKKLNIDPYEYLGTER
jgi:DNA-binding NtrC family response regulator